jgi:TolB-like protein
VLIAAAWFAARRGEGARDFNDVRVAVLPFDVESAGSDTAHFGDSLRDEILGVLARNQVQVISRGESLALKRGRGAVDRLKVGLLLDGAVERRGDTLRVRVHIEDPKAKTTLWSRTFEGPASDPGVVQTRAAGRATDVVSWLMSNRYGLGAPIDRATLSAYLEAGDEIQNQGGDRYLTIFRQIVARAPDFSWGHSGLGYALARAAAAAPISERPRLLDEVRREATTALRLDPQNGEAYALIAVVTAPLAWASRERLLSSGLAADPNSWAVPSSYATLLADVGRSREALAMQQRGVAAAPYWARGHALLARRLADVGRLDEARAELARAARLWPDDPDVIRIQAQFTRESGPTDVGVVPATPRLAVAVLARRGELDAAFAAAEQLASLEGSDDTYGYEDATSVLFAPVTAPLRRDPRFPPLAARLGLVDDWRRTGHWPDFCSEPGLPYDCKTEAARLARTSP